jgi:hypothetical protein
MDEQLPIRCDMLPTLKILPIRPKKPMSTLRKEGTDTADELVESGQRFYDEHLRQSLEPEHTGRYVAIEPDSGRYFLADTGTEALLNARQALPESLFYLARVGHPAADTLSGYGRRNG